jgi:hypothetical protein
VGGIAYGSGGVEQKESPELMTIRRWKGLYANDYVNHVESEALDRNAAVIQLWLNLRAPWV